MADQRSWFKIAVLWLSDFAVSPTVQVVAFFAAPWILWQFIIVGAACVVCWKQEYLLRVLLCFGVIFNKYSVEHSGVSSFVFPSMSGRSSALLL